MLRSFRTVRISVDHGQSRPGRALRRVDTGANLHSVKSFLLLLPTFLSLLIFCAHLFRAGALLLIPLVLFVLPLLLIKSGIVARLFQLLLLFIAMQWAIYAIGNRDRQNAYIALGITLLLGAAFANSTAYLYSQMGLVIADSPVGVLIYAISGAHLVLTIAALLYVGVVALRALGGEYTPRDHEGLSSAALFWYATVAVYALIWYTIFITK